LEKAANNRMKQAQTRKKTPSENAEGKGLDRSDTTPGSGATRGTFDGRGTTLSGEGGLLGEP